MAHIRKCSFIPSRILTCGRILFSVLAVFTIGVYVNAQTVVRTNGGTETATGTDVSVVQKADGYASGDVISVSGTSETSIAPFSASVRVEGSYTVDNFTVQSGTSDKQYIGALANSRNYVLKLGNKNYNLTFKNVEFQNNDVPQDTAGIFLIMDQATSTVTLNLDNASFTKFKGSKDGNYGGIINSSGDLTINGTNTVSFYGNGTGSGGAIFAGKSVTINCDEIIFDNNACNNSGAIRNSGALDITGSKVTFSNNSARNNGGSIYSTSTIKMTGKGDASVLTFSGNTAKNEGGVIYSEKEINLDFNTITFSDNQATNAGGAIRFNNSNTALKAFITGETVTFDNNSTLTKNGGVIHTNASVEMKGKSDDSVFTFSNNSAVQGNCGVIVAVGSVEFSTGSFIFQNNSAKGIAGAIEARKGITFSGDGTSATFTGNTAGTGNDLYLTNANTALTFQDNGTYYFDGGIYLSDATQTMVVDKAQVTIAGRSNVSNNNYQLQTVTISNGGKLTANLDYIDSLTGKFNVEEGTLEFNVGSGVAKELTPSEMFTISGYSTGSVVKSGAGKLTLVGDYSYSSPTTVNGGTLLVPSTGTNLATSKVTVASESEAVFQTGTNLNGVAFEIGEGGKFVVGETYASKDITIGALTLNGGTICFDFNDVTVLDEDYNIDTDWLHVSSAALSSGTIDLTFNSSSADDWWNVIKNNYGDDGFEIITGSISDPESFNNSANVKVSVNGTASNDWTLTATSDGLFLLAKGDEPAGDPWYYANTGDINASTWTIDGTTKQGVQFTDGGASATFAGEGGVILGTDGEFEIGTGRTLTISSAVSDGDGVSGGVIKTGDGTLKFTGDTTYTGVTTISEGTLEVNNNNFSSSSALIGNGTLKLKLTGSNKYFDIGDASEFTGTVQVYDENISANSRVQLAGANGTTPVNLDLSNATVELNGNTSGKYSELAFYKGGSSLKIGTLNGNKYGRILNVDSSSDAAYNNLTVGSGTFAGEIGREDAAGSQWSYVNKINLIKTGDGTFTFSGMPYYFGETNIQGGVLKFVNDNETGNKMFNRSKALKGSGTLQVVGNTNNWVCFAIDADASAPQEFSGTLDVSGNFVFYQNTNLGNATLHVAESAYATMHGGNTKNLTVKQLNTEAGSKVRISHASPGEGNFVTLTVGSGTVNGDLGEVANNAWYNSVRLNKVSDGSDDGGTLTLAGAFLYTGETTVSGGTLKLTGNAVSANAKMTVDNSGTLEYNVASGTKTLTIKEQNAIASTGQIYKTGGGTLQFDATEYPIDAKSLELVEGRLDLKGSMNGSVTVNGGVFSPGNSVGEANVTGNVTISDTGAILFEFSSYEEGLFDVLNIVNGDSTTDFKFMAGDKTIQLLFESGDEGDWAESFEINPDGYQLVYDNNFSWLGNLSDWLGTNKDLFGLEGRSDGLYLVAAGADPGPGPGPGPGPEPGSGVPEPSTWALLLLGAAGLLYWRKKNA